MWAKPRRVRMFRNVVKVVSACVSPAQYQNDSAALSHQMWRSIARVMHPDIDGGFAVVDRE